MTTTADVVVIGAGVIGAAIAYFCARKGLRVAVVERGALAAGASSRCEGNILVSDKLEGPELDLTLSSLRLWNGELAEYAACWEYQHKGGLVVAVEPATFGALRTLAARHAELGIPVDTVTGADLYRLEPHLAPDQAGAAYYPQDAQVQPMLVVAHLLRLAHGLGARVHLRTPVTGFRRDGANIVGVTTPKGPLTAPVVVNAAGPWAREVAAYAGVELPVFPRRGFILVTAPVPLLVRHKVYAASYIADVNSSDADLQASPVVEGTQAGTVLIGSTRERVGFDHRVPAQGLAALARGATALFPALGGATVLRHYHGFRPYSADHVPIIGPDERAPGLWHACGHEGAGIGLAPATGELIADAIVGDPTAPALKHFSPTRSSLSPEESHG